MQEIRTVIDIDAPAARVWQLLTDFAEFPAWNPFIRAVSGEPAAGSRLGVRLEPPGARGITLRPRVIVAEPPRELRWLGRLLVPGLFDGEHAFIVEPLGPERVRFIQTERFTGVLLPVFMRLLAQSTRRGFEAMNRALKTRAEQPPSTRQ